MTEIALSGVIGALSHALDIAEGAAAWPRRSVLPDRDASGRRARPERRGALRSLLRAAAQGRRLLGQRQSHGGAVRRGRPRGQGDVEARRLERPARGVPLVAADGGSRHRVCGAASRCCRAIRDEGDVTRKFMEARCDRGAEIARMLFLSEETATRDPQPRRALGRARHARRPARRGDPAGRPDPVSRADGRGLPRRRAASKAARAMAKRRRGRWFDPALVDAFLRFCGDREFWAELEAPDVSAVGAAGPRARRRRRPAGPRSPRRSRG